MGLNNIEVKRVNRNNLLMYILQTEEFSKRSAATALQLSIPTVTQCLNDLINMGLAKEEGTMASIGGRRSVGYRCIKDARTAVGIDITRNHVNLVILDLAMNIIYSRRVKMSLHDTEASYQELKSLIGRTIEESGGSIFLGSVCRFRQLLARTAERSMECMNRWRSVTIYTTL